MKRLNIPVLLGTVRKGRQSENVAKLIFEEVARNEAVDSELIDIRNIGLTLDDEGTAAQLPEFAAKMAAMDGLIIVSPEYNHNFSGSLKMALDRNLKEYANKAVGLVGVSSGNWGGTRVVEKLVNYTVRLGLKPIQSSKSLYFPNVEDLFDEEGRLTDQSYYKRISAFIAEVLWLSESLRWGRNNID